MASTKLTPSAHSSLKGTLSLRLTPPTLCIESPKNGGQWYSVATVRNPLSFSICAVAPPPQLKSSTLLFALDSFVHASDTARKIYGLGIIQLDQQQTRSREGLRVVRVGLPITFKPSQGFLERYGFRSKQILELLSPKPTA